MLGCAVSAAMDLQQAYAAQFAQRYAGARQHEGKWP